MIQYSEFDSEIFDKRIGRVSVPGVNHELVSGIKREGKTRDFDIIFIQAIECDYHELNNIRLSGFKLSDIKMDLINSKLPSNRKQQDNVYLSKDYVETDFGSLNRLVSRIAMLSQYNKFFGKEIALKLYEKWLRNTLDYTEGYNRYFLRERESDTVVGFIAAQLDKTTACMTLVAVDKKYQGRGVSQGFMGNVLADLSSGDIKKCSVGTQLQNRKAIKFYNSMGFYFNSYRFDFVLFLAL